MDSSQLKTWQAKVIYAALRPTLGYLYRLRERMQKRGFASTDKLFRLTATAYEALHAMTIELHYLSCDGGVGRKSTP